MSLAIASTSLQQLLDDARERHGVPGASLAVLQDGEISTVASGVLNVDTGVETTADSLFVKGGKLVHVYNFLGIPPEQKVAADAPDPGTHVVGVEFTKTGTGENHEVLGTLKLHVDDEVVAEDDIKTIASRYSLCGEGLCVGYDGGDAVSSEYASRFEFTGGRIVKVVFDVADDGYVDVERELAAAMSRD